MIIIRSRVQSLVVSRRASQDFKKNHSAFDKIKNLFDATSENNFINKVDHRFR